MNNKLQGDRWKLSKSICLLIRLDSWIFMKFKTSAQKIVIYHHIKFNEDPSFRCGDICLMHGNELKTRALALKRARIYARIFMKFELKFTR